MKTTFTICPRCSFPHKDQRAQRAGSLGGKAKVAKGFSNPEIRARALAAKKAKAI